VSKKMKLPDVIANLAMAAAFITVGAIGMGLLILGFMFRGLFLLMLDLPVFIPALAVGFIFGESTRVQYWYECTDLRLLRVGIGWGRGLACIYWQTMDAQSTAFTSFAPDGSHYYGGGQWNRYRFM
jgi:hypothetical protein